MLSLNDTAQQQNSVHPVKILSVFLNLQNQRCLMSQVLVLPLRKALGVWQTRWIETVLMKWDCVPGNLNHILPTFKVNSDMWTESDFAKLQRRMETLS